MKHPLIEIIIQFVRNMIFILKGYILVCVGVEYVCLDCIIYFLFEKQAFNGLLKGYWYTKSNIILLPYIRVNNDN